MNTKMMTIIAAAAATLGLPTLAGYAFLNQFAGIPHSTKKPNIKLFSPSINHQAGQASLCGESAFLLIVEVEIESSNNNSIAYVRRYVT